MHKSRFTSIILIFSIMNWFPIIAYVFFYPPLPYTVIFLLMVFCSPILAYIYIITALFLLLKKYPETSFLIIVIIVNIIYLVWSKHYLDVMYHMT